MKAAGVLVYVVLAFAGLAVRADEGDVAALVQQLASPKFAEREAATRKLKEIGDKAVPALMTARTSPEGEMRRRAELLLNAIHQRRDAELLLSCSKVRLKFDRVPVPTAVDQFAAQTGVQIVLDGDRTAHSVRTVTLDSEEVSFFQALELFCRKAGLVERMVTSTAAYGNPYSEVLGNRGIAWSGPSYLEPVISSPSRIVLMDAKGQTASPMFHAGAVRVRAITSGWTEPPRHTMKFEVFADPKLPFRGVAAFRIDRAVSDKGETLDVLEDDTAALDNRQISVRLSSPPKDCVKLAEVTGRASVLVEKIEELIAIDNVRDATGKAFKAKTGEALEIGEIDVRGPHCWVQLRLKFPSASVPAQLAVAQLVRARRFGSRTNADSVTSNILLFDSQGKLIPCTGTQTNLVPTVDGLILECSLSFQVATGEPAPARLIYHGRRVVAGDVRFVLRDVPLQ